MNVPARTEVVAVMHPALVPANMTEAIKLAELMASAKLVPQGLQKSPADCLMVVQQAIRWQMDPFAVAQECSVIQGKLMHSGKLVAAVVNSRGNLTQRLSYHYLGEAGTRQVVVRGQLHGEAEPRTVTVFLKDARTTAKVWQTQPDQQLMYHGVRVWARRHTPELMLGVYSPEEFDDVKADAEDAIAKGVSIYHPDDYAGGTPEKQTKPKIEAKPSKRAEAAAQENEGRYQALLAELVESQTITEARAWAKLNEIKLAALGDELRAKLRADYANHIEFLQSADEPVDETEPEPEQPSISERAIQARGDPGPIPKFLDRAK